MTYYERRNKGYMSCGFGTRSFQRCNLNLLRMSSSFSSLSYDRSMASSKTLSPQSTKQCLLFQFPVSCHFLKVIQQLLTYSFLSSRHLYPFFYLPFINVFQKAVSSGYRAKSTTEQFVLRSAPEPDIDTICVCTGEVTC